MTVKGFAMSYSFSRVVSITSVIIVSTLIFVPVTGFSKPRLELLPCRIDLSQNQLEQKRETRSCDDRKKSSLITRSPINDVEGSSSGGGSSGGGSSGGGVSPPLPPELPGRLIVKQFFSVTYRMSVIGFSFGNSTSSSHNNSHHLSISNPLAAADVTYGIGIGVATNGETTLVAVGGAFAATVTSTNMTQASATSSGQGLGVTYAFTAPLPKPAAGEVIKVSQMFSVVVTDTVPVNTNTQPITLNHDDKKKTPIQEVEKQVSRPTQAVIATDQAVLNANATLTAKSSDALVSALALTGSTTVITGEGVTPVTAHAVGAAGGAGLTSTQAPISSATPSNTTTSPIEINQTLTVKAETVIADTAKIPQSQNTPGKIIEQPTQTVALSASSSPPQNTGVTPATAAPLHAETVAQGTSTTNVTASSPDAKQTVAPSKDALVKEPTQDAQKQNVTPSPTASVKESVPPSAPSMSAPSANTAAPSSPKNAPTTPSTAQATAGASGGAVTGSGTLAAGAGAQAQSASQSSGPSQSSPAQAAASGGATAGAGASSVSPSQTATANGVSLASTGATLQKSP